MLRNAIEFSGCESDFPLASVDDVPASCDLPPVSLEVWAELKQYRKDAAVVRTAWEMGFISLGEAALSCPLDIPHISARSSFSSVLPELNSVGSSLSNIESLRHADGAGIVHVVPGGLHFSPRRPSSSHEHVSGKRGSVLGFSADSKRRLTRKLMLIDWGYDSLASRSKGSPSASAFFVSLTYGKLYPSDWGDYKADLRAFRERLTRRWGKLGIVWKLEYQSRGAPHFHLLVFTPSPVLSASFRRWVAFNWVELASRRFDYSSDYKRVMVSVHLGERSSGSCVVPVYVSSDDSGMARLMNYLIKYLAKEFSVDTDCSEFTGTGRCWGCWNEDLIPFGRICSYKVRGWSDYSDAVLMVVARGIDGGSRYLASLSPNRPFTLYGDGVSLFLSLGISYLNISPII